MTRGTGVLDPFSLKGYPRWHPSRLLPTVVWRLVELEARVFFERYQLPRKEIGLLPTVGEFDGQDTAVTEEQAKYLVLAVRETERLTGTVIVEVGSFRGIMTRLLARATTRTVAAVDPFMGYGGCAEDLGVFRRNTSDLANMVHVARTSGQALAEWEQGPVGMVFIDGVHDWANTRFDVRGWSRHVLDGGLIALHDTDTRHFAGTRKAVYDFSARRELFAHVEGLTILRRPRPQAVSHGR